MEKKREIEKNVRATEHSPLVWLGQTCEIAAKGFTVGEIFPYNRHVSSEADYLTAEPNQFESFEDNAGQPLNDFAKNHLPRIDEPGSPVLHGKLQQPFNECYKSMQDPAECLQRDKAAPSSDKKNSKSQFKCDAF
ncbi:hypothetical protein FQR65_LT03866 [Abscondita terminalis]|nr:hypothetical protein FQR65_LT03866 [Abscondita terminalis]